MPALDKVENNHSFHEDGEEQKLKAQTSFAKTAIKLHSSMFCLSIVLLNYCGVLRKMSIAFSPHFFFYDIILCELLLNVLT